MTAQWSANASSFLWVNCKGIKSYKFSDHLTELLLRINSQEIIRWNYKDAHHSATSTKKMETSLNIL